MDLGVYRDPRTLPTNAEGWYTSWNHDEAVFEVTYVTHVKEALQVCGCLCSLPPHVQTARANLTTQQVKAPGTKPNDPSLVLRTHVENHHTHTWTHTHTLTEPGTSQVLSMAVTCVVLSQAPGTYSSFHDGPCSVDGAALPCSMTGCDSVASSHT